MDALLAFLPYALLFLICPLTMLFMHRGHGTHGGGGDPHDHSDGRAELARRVQASQDETRP